MNEDKGVQADELCMSCACVLSRVRLFCKVMDCSPRGSSGHAFS